MRGVRYGRLHSSLPGVWGVVLNYLRVGHGDGVAALWETLRLVYSVSSGWVATLSREQTDERGWDWHGMPCTVDGVKIPMDKTWSVILVTIAEKQ